MAITTFAELSTAAANWLSRSDLTSRIPEFIYLAEAKFNRDLRCRQMEQRSTATATEYMALPTGFLELRNIQLNETPKIALEPISPMMSDRYYTDATGEPRYYEILANQIKLSPAPDGTYTVEIDYYEVIPALSASNTTNWLLTAAADVYLYGTLLESAPFLGDDPRLALWARMFEQTFKSLNDADRRARWAGAPMRVRVG